MIRKEFLAQGPSNTKQVFVQVIYIFLIYILYIL